MTKLRNAIVFSSAFVEYTVDEILGEGGAGRVYGGVDGTGNRVAIKVLTAETSEKKRRFKNEAAFLRRNSHPNIVTVSDDGLFTGSEGPVPFYVMPQYDGNLRSVISMITPDAAMSLFSKILDGVEAAHLQGVSHRDLKPENVLIREGDLSVVIADFGIAEFTAEHLLTAVQTRDTVRLANFEYAAPEQRRAGGNPSKPADIFALGLMLNELFTKSVPHGVGHQLIGGVAKEYGFLDEIVTQMRLHSPSERPQTIGEIKGLIQRYRDNAATLQRLDTIKGTVVKLDEISEPLAYEAPELINANWDGSHVHMTLNRPVNDVWIRAFYDLNEIAAFFAVGPNSFEVLGNTAVAPCREADVQLVINNFKSWLPQATMALKARLEREAGQLKIRREHELQDRRIADEIRLRVNSSITI